MVMVGRTSITFTSFFSFTFSKVCVNHILSISDLPDYPNKQFFFFFFLKKKSRYSDLRTTTKRRRRQRRDCFAVVWKDRHSKKNRRSFHSFSCWMQILLFTVVPHWLNSFSIFNRSYPVLCTHQITNIIYA